MDMSSIFLTASLSSLDKKLSNAERKEILFEASAISSIDLNPLKS